MLFDMHDLDFDLMTLVLNVMYLRSGLLKERLMYFLNKLFVK